MISRFALRATIGAPNPNLRIEAATPAISAFVGFLGLPDQGTRSPTATQTAASPRGAPCALVCSKSGALPARACFPAALSPPPFVFRLGAGFCGGLLVVIDPNALSAGLPRTRSAPRRPGPKASAQPEVSAAHSAEPGLL